MRCPVDCLFHSMVSTFAADRLRHYGALFAGALLAACSSSSSKGSASGVTAAPDGKPWQTLSEWHLFIDPVAQKPQDRVVPYDVNAPLFSDYAAKYRFIYVPDGAHIGYESTRVWNLPVGTILVKTFSFLADARDATKGQRLLETRLLIHEALGWVPHTYVWNADQTEAKLERIGDVIPSTFIDPSGKQQTDDYVVPTESDCRECHGKLGETNTLGGKTRQLERMHDYGSGPENQIDHLAKSGFFSATPEPTANRQHLVDPLDATQPINDRARAYFDANCGHCHQPGDAPGSISGYWLDYASTDPSQPSVNWGVCKHPTSAGGGTCGRSLDVVPGQPDDSILTCRLESTLGNVRMPPLGRNLVHAEGVAMVREWILALPGSCSQPPQADAGTPDASDGGQPTTDATPNDSGPG